eukprot:1106275-Rhodomonas_salina.1
MLSSSVPEAFTWAWLEFPQPVTALDAGHCWQLLHQPCPEPARCSIANANRQATERVCAIRVLASSMEAQPLLWVSPSTDLPRWS